MDNVPFRVLREYVSKLEEILIEYENPEIEVRFHDLIPFTQDRREGIGWRGYERLVRYIEENKFPVEENVITTVSMKQGNSTIRRVTTVTGTKYQRKKQIKHWRLVEFPIILACSTEEEIDEIPLRDSFTRIITRKSCLFEGHRLDISSVLEEDKVRYEVELEYIEGDRGKTLVKFERAIDILFMKIYNTRNLFKISQMKAADNIIKNVMRSPPVSATSLRRTDLRYSKLVGSKYVYYASNKADGIRKLLVINENELWLIYPHGEYNLVAYNYDFALYDKVILDGEFVQQNLKGEAVYYAFDMLSWSYDSFYNKPYQLRMKQLVNFIMQAVILKDVEILGFVVRSKNSIPIETVENFYNAMKDLFHSQVADEFQTDGIIFTPDMAYNPRDVEHDSANPYDLSVSPNIRKWKPILSRELQKDGSTKIHYHLTIDFLVNFSKGNPHLFVFDTREKDYVEFKGDFKNPVKKIQWQNDIRKVDGSIVEFGYDTNIKSLIPVKFRADKLGPNSLRIALDVWKSIFSPVSKEDLLGISVQPAFWYHSRVKHELYENIPENSILLDIGSGRGGDIGSWSKRNLTKVFAVEPNEKNRKKFESRLRNSKLNVTIIPTGGEDVNLRSKVKNVDCITLMLCLSFFWESKQMLVSLLENCHSILKKNGRILFLTQDGDSVEQLFHDAFDYPLPEQRDEGASLIIPQIHEKRVLTLCEQPNAANFVLEGTKLEITLPRESITAGKEGLAQVEYLVYLRDMLCLLQQFGEYRLEFAATTDTEKFLSTDQKLYAALFLGGILTKVGDKKLKCSAPYSMSIPGEVASFPNQDLMKVVLEDVEAKRKQEISEELDKLSITRALQKESEEVVKYLPPSPKLEIPIVPNTELPEKIIKVLQEKYNVTPSESMRKTKILELQALSVSARGGDDQIEVLDCLVFGKPVYRIATIGDGNCFIHALAKALYIPYRLKSYIERKEFAQKFREELANLLVKKTLFEGEEFYWWERIGHGTLVGTYLDWLASLKESLLDTSIEGLTKHFDSNDWLDNKVYEFIAEVLKVNVLVYLGHTGENCLEFINFTNCGVPDAPVIVIIGNKTHYEPLGVEDNGLLRTLFRYPEEKEIIDSFLAISGGTQEEKEKDTLSNEIRKEILSRFRFIWKGHVVTILDSRFALPDNPTVIDQVYYDVIAGHIVNAWDANQKETHYIWGLNPKLAAAEIIQSIYRIDKRRNKLASNTPEGIEATTLMETIETLLLSFQYDDEGIAQLHEISERFSDKPGIEELIDYYIDEMNKTAQDLDQQLDDFELVVY